MTSHVAVVPDVLRLSTDDADIRWREWQARGAEQDRRRASHMRRSIMFVAIALAIGLLIRFV